MMKSTNVLVPNTSQSRSRVMLLGPSNLLNTSNNHLRTGGIRSVGNLTPLNNLQQSIDKPLPQKFQRKSSHLIVKGQMKALPNLKPQGIYSLRKKPSSVNQESAKRLRQSLQVTDGIPPSSRNSQVMSLVGSYTNTGKNSTRNMNRNLIQKSQLLSYQDRSITVQLSQLPLTPIGQKNHFVNRNFSHQNFEQAINLNQDMKKKIQQRQSGAKLDRLKLESLKNQTDISLLSQENTLANRSMGAVNVKYKVDHTLPIDNKGARSPYSDIIKKVAPGKPLQDFSKNKSQLNSYSALAASQKNDLLRPQALIQLRSSQQVLDTWTPQTTIGINLLSDVSKAKQQSSLAVLRRQGLNNSILTADQQSSIKKLRQKDIAFALQNYQNVSTDQMSLLHQPKISLVDFENQNQSKLNIPKVEIRKDEKKAWMEKQIDQSMFQFTFNKETEEYQQPITYSEIKFDQQRDRVLSAAQNSFKSPTQMKVTNGTEDFSNNFENLNVHNCIPRIRPISYVRDRNQNLINHISSNNSEYSNKNSRSGSRPMSGVRPTSGMNSYLKGKLPDCFLLESQPLVRKNPSSIKNFLDKVNLPSADAQSLAPAQAYVSYSVKSPSVTNQGSDTNAKTRIHSAKTYIHFPSGDNKPTESQLDHPIGDQVCMASGQNQKQIIIPILPINPLKNEIEVESLKVQFKKPLITRKLLGQIISKNSDNDIQKRNAQSSRLQTNDPQSFC